MSESKQQIKWLRKTLWLLIVVASMFLLVSLSPYLPRSGRYPLQQSVVVEITQLQQAIMQFKVRFGIDPPSHITLYEDSSAPNQDPESRSLTRRLWPQFDFQGQWDLNGDGDTGDVHHLTGAECLVFFLGGIRRHQGAFAGFSKAPLTPFSMDGQNREGPFFEFDMDRLTDVDEDGFAEYSDRSSQMPYLYASGERRYREGDLAVYPEGDDRNMKQVYRNAMEEGIREYQIISAGADSDYGQGGLYTGEFEFELNGTRRAEADNLTNFANGRLGSH